MEILKLNISSRFYEYEDKIKKFGTFKTTEVTNVTEYFEPGEEIEFYKVLVEFENDEPLSKKEFFYCVTKKQMEKSKQKNTIALWVTSKSVTFRKQIMKRLLEE